MPDDGMRTEVNGCPPRFEVGRPGPAVKHRLPGSHANLCLWRPLVALTGAAAPRGGAQDTGAFRRWEAFSRGVLPSHKELYPKLTLRTPQRRERNRILAHFPSHLSVLTGPTSFVSEPARVTHSLLAQDRGQLPRPSQAGLLAAHHTGPVRVRTAGHAVCFAPGQGLGLGLRVAPLAFQEGRAACSPGRLFTRPPCLQLRLLRGFVLSTPGSESLSPGLARRRGALESLGHTASLRGQGTPCPESERPQKVIHSVQRGREHCPRGPVQSLPCRLCQRGSCDPSP